MTDYTVHPSAIVDDGAKIGAGSRIWHFAHICGGAEIGKNCSFGQNVFVGNRVKIGDNCKIQNNVSVYDNVYLEDGVFCGPSMVFTNVYNPRSLIERKSEYRDTRVEKGATLGANCTIVCGVTIGEFGLKLRQSACNLFGRGFGGKDGGGFDPDGFMGIGRLEAGGSEHIVEQDTRIAAEQMPGRAVFQGGADADNHYARGADFCGNDGGEVGNGGG